IRKEICDFIDKNPNKNQTEVANFFNEKYELTLDRTTISKTYKKKELWNTVNDKESSFDMYCHREVKYPNIENAIEIWVQQAVAKGLPLSDQLLKEKDVEEEVYNYDDNNNLFSILQNWSNETTDKFVTALADNLFKYLDSFNTTIPTEEDLTDDQIVQLVLEKEKNHSESDNSEFETPLISVKKRYDALKT
ncbi:5587_t:CDS:2, partial [Scutellospora calospora]